MIARWFGSVLLLVTPWVWNGIAEAAASKPNIVLIVVDDLGYGELGCQGNPEIPTPHIDSIARNGIRFTQGYVTASYCAPSRAGLITGRYQTRFGCEHNPVGKQNLAPNLGLPQTEKTIAQHLREADYATALVGKWHLGGTPAYHPQNRGFDEFYGFLHEGHFFVPPPYRGVYSRLRPNEPPYDADNPLLRGEEPVAEQGYLTDALTREAISFIDRHQSKPFFLYLPYNAVHSPMQAKLEDVESFRHLPTAQRAVFGGMLAALDRSIGSVLARLREHNLEENTLIFFLSDHGGPTAELTSQNTPLSGGKGNLLEGGIRVPFMVQWKGRLPAGITFERPVSSLDILPTALAAAGVDQPDNLDGVNLLPFLTGIASGDPHEAFYWRMGPQAAVRRGPWKYYQPRSGPAKLFHVERDPAEQRDLSAEEPALLEDLQAQWKTWSEQQAEPQFIPAWLQRANDGSPL